MPRNDHTDFVIEVLEGRQAGLEVPLNGRTAPYRSAGGGSISFGGSQRVKTVWPQGNPVATQLVFGPTIDPTTINGVWSDRYIGADGAIDLVETFEDIRDRGAQVRVSWSTREWVGVIKSFVWRPGVPTGGLADIAWTMTFEWSASTANPRLFLPRATSGSPAIRESLADVARSISDTINAVVDLVENVRSFAGNLRVASAGLRRDLESFVDNAGSAVTTIADTISRISRGSGEATEETLNQGSTAIDSAIDEGYTLAEALRSTTFFALADSDRIVDILAIEELIIEVTERLYRYITRAYEVQVRLEDLLAPEIELEIPAVIGEDLRKIAYTFYGRADDWTRIAQANGIIEGSVVPEDLDTIIIPLGLPAALDARVQE